MTTQSYHWSDKKQTVVLCSVQPCSLHGDKDIQARSLDEAQAKYYEMTQGAMSQGLSFDTSHEESDAPHIDTTTENKSDNDTVIMQEKPHTSLSPDITPPSLPPNTPAPLVSDDVYEFLESNSNDYMIEPPYNRDGVRKGTLSVNDPHIYYPDEFVTTMDLNAFQGKRLGNAPALFNNVTVVGRYGDIQTEYGCENNIKYHLYDMRNAIVNNCSFTGVQCKPEYSFGHTQLNNCKFVACEFVAIDYTPVRWILPLVNQGEDKAPKGFAIPAHGRSIIMPDVQANNCDFNSTSFTNSYVPTVSNNCSYNNCDLRMDKEHAQWRTQNLPVWTFKNCSFDNALMSHDDSVRLLSAHENAGRMNTLSPLAPVDNNHTYIITSFIDDTGEKNSVLKIASHDDFNTMSTAQYATQLRNASCIGYSLPQEFTPPKGHDYSRISSNWREFMNNATRGLGSNATRLDVYNAVKRHAFNLTHDEYNHQ